MFIASRVRKVKLTVDDSEFTEVTRRTHLPSRVVFSIMFYGQFKSLCNNH